LPRGPWHLGRFAPAINVIAIAWVLFITVILSIPDGARAGKAMAGLTLLLGVWFAVSERQRFRPVVSRQSSVVSPSRQS
jgi:hypothetical protein